MWGLRPHAVEDALIAAVGVHDHAVFALAQARWLRNLDPVEEDPTPVGRPGRLEVVLGNELRSRRIRQAEQPLTVDPDRPQVNRRVRIARLLASEQQRAAIR